MTATGSPGRLLRWYPPAWRDRYGEEFVAYMQDSFGSGRPPLTARLSVAAGGIRERARRSGLTGDSVAPADRIRAGILLVLVSWTGMVLAGSSFAKLSEHFDTALGPGAGPHHLPDVAVTVVQTVGGVAGLVVLAAAGLALPPLVRYLRSGGRSAIRGHALRAGGATVLAAGATAPLVIWAHRLTVGQRNGGSPAYSILFVAWAVLVAIAVVMGTVLAVASARRVTFSRRLLAAEAALAVAVTFAIIGILAATSVWWAVMAQRAPTFLSGDPASPVSARLAATVALMTLAGVGATTGAVRIVRSLPEWSGRSGPATTRAGAG